jgi:hypothetical protein
MLPLFSNPDWYELKMPIISFRDSIPAIMPVRYDSPFRHRQAVYRIAKMFRREMGFDFVQYGHNGNETDEDCVAWLFFPGDCEYLTAGRVHACGAACFRLREDVWAMQWVWLYPLVRRKGILSGVWDFLKLQHGDFTIEEPLSDAMTSFCQKLARQS